MSLWVTGLDKHFFSVKMSYPSVLTYVLGTQKNHLIELQSTNNICLGWEIRKLIFWYTLLTKACPGEAQTWDLLILSQTLHHHATVFPLTIHCKFI